MKYTRYSLLYLFSVICTLSFSQKDIDGGLIGGASLNADDFVAITQSF